MWGSNNPLRLLIATTLVSSTVGFQHTPQLLAVTVFGTVLEHLAGIVDKGYGTALAHRWF
jgi:hypothetical protein